MSYLDPKERVIDLQLTSYGKYLLSMGRLKPAYYAFFDDDVIYDGTYADMLETQSEIEPRIQENTPRLSAQAVFSGRELEIFTQNPNIFHDLIIGSDEEDNEIIEKGLVKIQDGPEHEEIFQQPLGRSNPAYQYAPAWNVKFYKAALTSSADYLEISSSRGSIFKNIPQLEADVQYMVYKNSSKQIKNNTARYPRNNLSEQTVINFQDGAQISVGDDGLILKIEESNTFFENDNFEIECYEVLTIDGKETLMPLKFYSNKELLQSANANKTPYDTHSFEQYCTIEVDTEIDSEIICPYITEDTTKHLYNDKMFDCEEMQLTGSHDIYFDIDDTKDICE
jgi:hypothetical protein